MTAEFTCCECGREITRVGADQVPEMRLCFLCMEMPGWYRIPQMRAFLCADHDGREVWERENAPTVAFPSLRGG
ncbi:hypothetical protein [Methylobacterium flocculans]|uniref:hypothetical protein n=1 Tax=Methylobacterium flocculans TaxID=2984843 RepID=UPI0021F3B669|nr:hypothetical protein [Methylobacterium sp. FF17]